MEDNIISFDNLAIEQLNLFSKISSEIRKATYQGDDFTHTMYIDAVEQTFAPTSRAPKNDRVSWSTMGLSEYFKKNKCNFDLDNDRYKKRNKLDV
jgi:hypothetical protein